MTTALHAHATSVADRMSARRRLRSPSVVRCWAALCLLFFSAPGWAICVDSSIELLVAINNASAVPGNAVIEIESGTYFLPDGFDYDPVLDSDKSLTITGGWDNDCGKRTLGPSSTVVDFQAGQDGPTAFFWSAGRIVVENIQFRNFERVSFGLHCQNPCSDTVGLRIEHNEFVDGKRLDVYADRARATFRNNVVAQLEGGDSDGTVQISTEDVPGYSFLDVAHNTFADIACKTSDQSAVIIYADHVGRVLHHNVFDSSCSSDVGVADASVTLRHNAYSSVAGPATALNNVVGEAPDFVGGGNYRLTADSPLVDKGMTVSQAAAAGLPVFPVYDLDGNWRVRNVNVDIGAYESGPQAGSNVLVVKSAADDGSSGETLREAIETANALAGPQQIVFDLPGSCPRLIALATPLPDITDPLEIDGYSQNGAAPNTEYSGPGNAQLCVMLVPGAPGPGVTLPHFLRVASDALPSVGLTVKGLAFASASILGDKIDIPIRLEGGSGHVIYGNAFAGKAPPPLGDLGEAKIGIRVTGSSQGVMIGGPEAEHRNTFGSMTVSAIQFMPKGNLLSGHLVPHTAQNNHIGMAMDYQSIRPITLDGVFVFDIPDVRVLDNVIMAAGASGIRVTGPKATGVLVEGNIVQPPSGYSNAMCGSELPGPCANGTGILVSGAAGGNLFAHNDVRHSKVAGIWIHPSAAQGNTLQGNYAVRNGYTIENDNPGAVGQNIDIGTLGRGVDDQDAGDEDMGANDLQNWPQIIGAASSGADDRIATVTLQSRPDRQYRIELFDSPNGCHGGANPNAYHVFGDTIATTDGDGVAQTEIHFPAGMPGSKTYLSATATDLVTGDTSELSDCYADTVPVGTTTQITGQTPQNSEAGASYMVKVRVLAQQGVPSGTVSVKAGDGIGTGKQCMATLDAAGEGVCTLMSFQAGVVPLMASYPGAGLHAPSQSASASHLTGPATTKTSIVQHAPGSSTVGQPYTVYVKVGTLPGNSLTPAGSVVVGDGTDTCDIAVLDAAGAGSCTLVSTSPGPKSVTASYEGGGNFKPSEATPVMHPVTSTGNPQDAIFANGFE